MNHFQIVRETEQSFWRCSVCRRKGQDSHRNTGTPSGSTTSTMLPTTSRTGRQPSLRLNQRWSDEKPLQSIPISSQHRKKSADHAATASMSLMTSNIASTMVSESPRRDKRITASDNDLKQSMGKIQLPPKSRHHGVQSVEDIRVAVESSQLKMNPPERRAR